ncbi:MAG: pitrilysin family protein [Rhizobiaceae bacterium]
MRLQTKTNLRGVYFIPAPTSTNIIVHPVIIAGEADFDGPEGLAHYLEHLMFWHADKQDNKFSHGRGENAWANGLVTSYIATGTKSQLDEIFSFAGRILTAPTLDNKFMLDERKVVAREYDLRVSENPYRRAWNLLWPIVLPKHPFTRSVIGTPSSIHSLTLDHAYSFFNKHYTPANTVLLITGNISATELVGHIEKTFGHLPAGASNKQNWRRNRPVGSLNETIEIQDRYLVTPGLSKAAIGTWSGTGERQKDLALLALTKHLLLSTLEGSLAKPLRMDYFVFSEFYLDIFSLIEGQVQLYFSGALDNDVSFKQANADFNKALQNIAQKGITLKVLKRIKKRLTKTMLRNVDDPRYMLNHATTNLSFGVLPIPTNKRLQLLESVTIAEVNGVLRALAKAERWATAKLMPKG